MRLGMLVCLFVLIAFNGSAEEPVATQPKLREQTGTFAIGQQAILTTGSKYVYLDEVDAKHLLTDVMGNPASASEGVLGVVYPKDIPIDDPSSYFVVITYEGDGYVSDKDAENIDYDELLDNMKKGVIENNAERKKAGYAAIDLKGWAERPHYDKASHKIYWAKQLHFEDEEGDTLNYCIRALGRSGVLALNVVTGVENLAEVKHAAPDILAMVDFREEQSYAAFNPSVDKVAAYGLAGLVAGGVLAKTGFFKVLAGMGKALFLLIFGGLAAVWSAIKRFFGSKE